MGCLPGALNSRVCSFQTPGGAPRAAGATGYELPGVGGGSSDKVAEFGEKKNHPGGQSGCSPDHMDRNRWSS